MPRTSVTPHDSRRGHGFTLVELLVVIGIIALLISILLPSLNEARRQANRVKCLAALREIGNGFFLYATDHDGAWPVAVHTNGNTRYPLPPGVERRWPDLIARYVSGTQDMARETDIEKIRERSVVWGCPEWTKSFDFTTDYADRVRVGYGMQYYGGDYFEPPVTTAKFQTDFAYITAGTPPAARGLYMRQAQFSKRAADRGLIADSMTHIINVPGFPSYEYTQITQWQPYDGFVGTPVGAAFYVDATRHIKKDTPKNDGVKGFNMLFCDGHAEAVSVREAWEAITLKKAP